MPPKINVGSVTKKRVINPQNSSHKISIDSGKCLTTKITFNFKYWKQIEHFGLNKADNSWFISFLERVKELENFSIDELFRDFKRKDDLHLHKVKWDQKNIPIQRSDICWVPKEIIENETEYEFYQIAISGANGRIVFFNDMNNLFIVLLDHQHNICPTGFTGYRVDDCSPLSSKYDSLICDIKKLQGKGCGNQECSLKKSVKAIPTCTNQENVLMHLVEKSVYDEVMELVENKEVSDSSEIIELGLLLYNEKK